MTKIQLITALFGVLIIFGAIAILPRAIHKKCMVSFVMGAFGAFGGSFLLFYALGGI